MEPILLSSLWLPIVISAVVVFFASAIAWMVLPHHRSDWAKLPDEESAREALKGVPTGEYTIPHAATPNDRKSEDWQTKASEGPLAFVTVIPASSMNMGKSLAQWFVHCLLVSIFVAYVTAHALAAGSDYLKVFQVAGTVAFLAYSAAHVPGAIWMGHGWGRALKDVADGLVYGLLTAGVFGWLWP